MLTDLDKWLHCVKTSMLYFYQQEDLLLALTKHIDNNSMKTDSFVVNAKGTVISKNTLRKVSMLLFQ